MQFYSLTGLTPYELARELQQRLVELRAADRIEDTVLLLEHEPVVTRGRGLQFTGAERPRHMPLPAPLPAGVAFAESERGGDLTYHGPGQLVIYPIFKLDGSHELAPARDIGAFLRRFEQVFVDRIGDWTGGRARGLSRESATGVWIEPVQADESESRGAEPRKLASMGIAVRKWVTYHGLAINCVNDLKPFHLISPCGFAPEVMTRLADWVIPQSIAGRALEQWSGGQGRAVIERDIAAGMSASAAGRMAARGADSYLLKLISAAELLARLELLPIPESSSCGGEARAV